MRVGTRPANSCQGCTIDGLQMHSAGAPKPCGAPRHAPGDRHGPRRTDTAGTGDDAPDLARRVLDAVHAESRIQGRPADDRPRGGHVFLERQGREDHRRVVGPLLLRRGTRPARDRRGGRPPARRARLLGAVPARSSQAVRARDADRRAHARRPQPDLLRQLRLGSRRHGDEGRPRLSPGARPGRAQRVRVARARLSRRQFRRRVAVGPRQQSPQVRPGAAGHRPHAAHAPQGELLHAGRRRARRRARRGPPALRQPVRRREHRGVLRRADRRVDRLPRAAEGLPQAAARDLRRARHPARLRRGDHRLRPHRTGVRRAELRRHAGHDHDGEGAHQRRAADERGRRRASASTTRSAARPPKARSSSSTATPTRAIRRRARRGSRRSTSTGTTACSSAAARCRRTSRTRSSRCATFPRSPTSAATACSPRSTCTPPATPGRARSRAAEEALRQRPQPQDDRRLRAHRAAADRREISMST